MAKNRLSVLTRPVLTVLFGAVVLLSTVSGCATAKPQVQVTGAKQIAGSWRGTLYLPAATLYRLVVREDGTWQQVGTARRGTFSIRSGVVEWADASGQKGVWRLRQEGSETTLEVLLDGKSVGELSREN